MANELGVKGVSSITHLQTCELHGDERIGICSGTLKKGGHCVNRATDSPVLGMMPTCKIHREQRKALGFCRAELLCGFECGRSCEWKPYEFHLCPSHREYPMPCYFLRIAIELRFRIYRFLLPDRPIPASFISSRSLTTNGERIYAAILRVNKQIHDETTSLLYSQLFTIEISGNHLIMCNSAKNLFGDRMTSTEIHALQDYQMQLMLLEQQNKKRALMARQEQDGNQEPSTSYAPTNDGIQLPAKSSIYYPREGTAPVWHPPISMKYFNMIQRFQVEIVFPFERSKRNHTHHGYATVDDANQKVLESRLYEYCDSIHWLMARIQLIQIPIVHVEIIIRFFDNYRQQEEAFMAAQVLLHPFQRLRNITKPRLRSITMGQNKFNEIELLTQDWRLSEINRPFIDFLERWEKGFSSSEAPIETSYVFEAYWQLEHLLQKMRGQSNHNFGKFEKFTTLLRAARISREKNDLMSFREVWDQVLNIWLDYLNSEKNFQSNMARSIDTICDIVGRDSDTDNAIGSASS